ncbi:MAG: hypothetical protein K8T89_00850, partial [Planctomycetes bacterium]|nr:hypothetical protein [Planctomycetota bacterium]
MSRRRFTFGLVTMTSVSMAIIMFWDGLYPALSHSTSQLLADSLPAREKEWVPAPSEGPGAIEMSLRSVVPPAETPQAVQPLQAKEQIKSDLLLPAAQPSFNLNLTKDEGIRPVGNAEPLPVVAPPVDVVPPPPISVPEIAVPKIELPPLKLDPVLPEIKAAPPELTTPLNLPPEDATMNSLKFAVSAIVGAALLASPVTAAEPKEDFSKSIEKLEAAVLKLNEVEKSLTAYKISNAAAVSQAQIDIETMKAKIRSLEDEIKIMKANAASGSTSKRET